MNRPMTKYGTNFVESEALLAITAEDVTEAERILRGMTQVELVMLARHAAELKDRVMAQLRINRRAAADGGGV